MDLSMAFETPLIISEVEGAQELNRDLRASILARRQSHPDGMSISNRLGWHSDTEMLEWGGPATHRLMNHVIDLANEHTVDIGATTRRFLWVPEMWANISESNASNQFHCHAGSSWAAVYYVDDGYGGSPDRSLGGELELEDPRIPMVNMEAPDLRFRPKAGGPPAGHEVLIRPATGRLLLFPGWLRHGVRPYRGSLQRLSIAMNLTAIRVPTDFFSQHPDLPGPMPQEQK